MHETQKCLIQITRREPTEKSGGVLSFTVGLVLNWSHRGLFKCCDIIVRKGKHNRLPHLCSRKVFSCVVNGHFNKQAIFYILPTLTLT